MKLSHVLAGAVLLFAILEVRGEPPLREAWSENRDFQLRIDAGRAGKVGRPCRAELFSGLEGRVRRVWTHLLVNDSAPARVIIRNDGKYVVTLDEHERGGARHALVIYGEDGELLRHFLLPDLLEQQDWQHVKLTDRTLDWLTGAKFAFDDKLHQFVIELAWGRKLQIDLRRLQVVRTGRDAAAPAEVPTAIASVLYGHAAGDADFAATLEALPDQPDATPGVRPEAGSNGQPIAPETAQVEGAPGMDPDALVTDAGVAADEPLAGASPGDEAYFIVPQSEIAVPRPNPADKVDYVAWFNDLGVVDGPDAMEFYDQALAQKVDWAGDGDLLSRAMEGDPEALAAPEIQEWLAANAGALAAFRAGTQLPERGWKYASNDGSMIGVMLPELAGLRTLARASIVEARRLAATGRPMDAAYECLDVLAAGAHTGSGLTLIENLVGVAMQAPGQEALLDLQADPGNSGQLDYVQLAAEAEVAYQPTRSPADCMQAERSMFMDTVQRMWDVDPASGAYVFRPERLDGLVENGAVPAEMAARFGDVEFEDTVREGELYYDALVEAASEPYPVAQQRMAALEDLVAGSASANPVLKMLTPSLSRAMFIRTRAETARRATVLTTYLNAYRQQFGEYPESLDVFADREFVTDPFTQGRFAYRREGDNFVLYSLGRNGTDEAGAHDPKGESNDVLFWPRPAR